MLQAVEMILPKPIFSQKARQKMTVEEALPVVEVLSGRDWREEKAMYVLRLSVVPYEQVKVWIGPILSQWEHELLCKDI